MTRCMDEAEFSKGILDALRTHLLKPLKRYEENARILRDAAKKTQNGNLALMVDECNGSSPRAESSCGGFNATILLQANNDRFETHFLFKEKSTGCEMLYSLNDSGKEKATTAASRIASRLHGYGYATKDMLTAFAGAAKDFGNQMTLLAKDIESRMSAEGLAPGAWASKQTIDEIIHKEKERLEARTKKHLPACLKEVEKIEEQLKCLSDTVNIVEYAKEVFGSLNNILIQHHFKDGVFEYSKADGFSFAIVCEGMYRGCACNYFAISYGDFSTKGYNCLKNEVESVLMERLVDDDDAARLSQSLKAVREELADIAKWTMETITSLISSHEEHS